ncbi:hypothetical protein JCGZ_20242 [Jatropha curcas]|uniref:Uncharacterized protein n=1 Tax=Jatropha curcas TaxID=180498 RepID=A0A067K6H0_JATCU|nr:hypothetical protein JCGZ_20242 [Jatropha curcas]
MDRSLAHSFEALFHSLNREDQDLLSPFELNGLSYYPNIQKLALFLGEYPWLKKFLRCPRLDIDPTSLIMLVFGFPAYEIPPYALELMSCPCDHLLTVPWDLTSEGARWTCPWWYIERVTISSYMLCVPLCGLSMALAYYPSRLAKQYGRQQAVPNYNRFGADSESADPLTVRFLLGPGM